MASNIMSPAGGGGAIRAFCARALPPHARRPVVIAAKAKDTLLLFIYVPPDKCVQISKFNSRSAKQAGSPRAFRPRSQPNPPGFVRSFPYPKPPHRTTQVPSAKE